MKKAFNLLLVALACGVAGCVHTVTENQPGRGPGYRDYVEARHAKTVDVVLKPRNALCSALAISPLTARCLPLPIRCGLWKARSTANGW